MDFLEVIVLGLMGSSCILFIATVVIGFRLWFIEKVIKELINKVARQGQGISITPDGQIIFSGQAPTGEKEPKKKRKESYIG